MSSDCIIGAWRAHKAELRGYLIHRLGDVDSAEDLLQETFLKSLRQGAGFCEIGNPRAWLFQIARHALIDRVRLAKAHVELPDQLAAPQDDGREPVDELDACLLRTLSEMAAADRQIIEQCDLLGVRQQVFAQTHALSLAATKSRLLRARQRLREALASSCQVHFDDTGRVCCHVPRD